jgi:hypothetical protein
LQLWLLPAIALLFSALCINLSWVQSHHDGDSVLLPLISTVRWTPFYWGDNRYGMPVPLLASWVSDPSWNALLQSQCFAFAVVACVVVVNLFFLHAPRTPAHVRLGTACIALVLGYLCLRPTQRAVRSFLLADPYVISLAPLLAAVAVVLRVERGSLAVRLLAATPLAFVALWINFSHVLIAAPLALLLPHASLPWRETRVMRATLLGIMAACCAVVRVWASYYRNWGEPSLAIAGWADAMWRLLLQVSEFVVYPAPVAALALSATVSAVYLRRSGKLRAADAGVFLLAAAALASAVAVSDWPMHNKFEPRYWTTPVLLLLLVLTSLTGRVLFGILGQLTASSRLAVALAALLLTGASVRAFGLPDPWTARETLLTKPAFWGAHALTLGCTHMIGEYEVAWMSVFYGRSMGQDLWAAVPRGEITRDLWDRVPPRERRFCASHEQGTTMWTLALFNLGVPAWSGTSGPVVRYQFP